MSVVDTSNRFLVGTSGGEIAILGLGLQVTKDNALNLAAWLAVLADDDDEFLGLYDAVRSS